MINENIITATKVVGAKRLKFMFKYFGPYSIWVEKVIFNWMERLSKKNTESYIRSYLDRIEAHYDGGEWDFYELSNGGIFLAPNNREQYRISVSGNYFDDVLSAHAAGIVATLFLLSQLSETDFPYSERCCEYYHQLMDYAYYHPEYSKIRAAID